MVYRTLTQVSEIRLVSAACTDTGNVCCQRSVNTGEGKADVYYLRCLIRQERYHTRTQQAYDQQENVCPVYDEQASGAWRQASKEYDNLPPATRLSRFKLAGEMTELLL